jgi:hypothetical protein
METEALGTAALVATFLIPIVSLIKQDSWRPEARQLLGLVAAFVAAIVAGLVDGDLKLDNWEAIFAYFATARVVAETVYAQYFNKTEANAKLEAVGS